MLLDNYIQFLDNVFKKLNELGIDVSGLNLDHIAYQASDEEDYQKLLLEFIRLGELKHEGAVGSKRIAVIKLLEELKYKEYTIPVVELVQPDPEISTPSDWQHFEFVIEESYQDFISKYPKVNWNDKKINREIFPMLILPIGEFVEVRFHQETILKMVQDL